MGSIFTSFIAIIVTLFPFVLVVLFYLTYKKNVKNTEERLNIEKQQTINLQKQVDDLKERVGEIETVLKEVD